MVVPADLDRRGDRQTEQRQRCETLCNRLRPRSMTPSRPGQMPSQTGDAGDCR
jgi:hypothetical protein